MISDLISRKAAISAIESHIRTAEEPYQLTEKDRVVNYAFDVAISCLLNLPSAEPKTGKWVERESYAEDKEDGFETTIACSCCDYPATIFYSEDGESRTQIRTDYCPNCGAKMKGEGE